jgi:hypothetical protein
MDPNLLSSGNDANDTNVVIRSHKSKRSRLYSGQKVKDNNKTTIYRNAQLVSILGLGHRYLWTGPYVAPYQARKVRGL